MNVFRKITLASLKENKTRTVVTVIGVMLSTALICAVTTLLISVQTYLLGYITHFEGDWHISSVGTDAETLESLSQKEEIEHLTYSRMLGYAKVESQNKLKPYLYVIAGKDNYFDIMPIHLMMGKYPENANEILLPAHALTDGKLPYKVGDTVTLAIGTRLYYGMPMYQGDPCYKEQGDTGDEILNDETIEVRETLTYTVVGIYERPSFEATDAPGYTAITVTDTSPDASSIVDIYFKMKDPRTVYTFLAENAVPGADVNTDALLFMGVSRMDTFTTMTRGLAAILIAVIMFGSVSLIYNAFAISVSERTKQFGLLTSIGATRKQVRGMVLFEALCVSAVGIPLGICVGVGGIGITLLIIGHKFMLLPDYDVPTRLVVSWGAIAVAIVVALITVLISAWIPSLRATRVSPLEAIRQNADIKVGKRKRARTAKLRYRLFGFSGMIASKYFRRDRKKYRTTVLSLVMSMVLFVTAWSLAQYLVMMLVEGYGIAGYELCFRTSDASLQARSEEIYDIFMSDEDVTDAVYLYQGVEGVIFPFEYMAEEVARDYLSKHKDAEGFEIIMPICFVNDSTFDALLEEYKLDREKYYNKEAPYGIFLEPQEHFYKTYIKYEEEGSIFRSKQFFGECINDKEYYNGYLINYAVVNENGERVMIYINPNNREDYIEVSLEEAKYKYTLQGDIVSGKSPYYLEEDSLTILYPLSMLHTVIPDEGMHGYKSLTYYICSDDHDASYDRLQTALLENNISPNGLYDRAKSEEQNRNIVTIIEVFSYGFVVLISLIAVANIFNTVSTNAILRQREFAMLKSVGMSEKSFGRMLGFESLIYGTKALLWGLPISVTMSYLVYYVVEDMSGGFTWNIPWLAIVLSVIGVFGIVYITMRYAVYKVKHGNTIDILRNENI